MVGCQYIRVLAKQANAFEQEIAEIAGVEDLEAGLIGSIRAMPLP